MIRKLFFATLGAALLGGCVTGYQYRGGSGDYYYGQPSTQYYDAYDSYGYGPYGGGPGWSGVLGLGYGYGGYYGPYGYPYGGYGGFYGYGHGHHHRPPVIVVPDPPADPRPDDRDRPRRDDHDAHDRFIMRRPLSSQPPRAMPQAAVAKPMLSAPGRAAVIVGGDAVRSLPAPRVEPVQRAPARAAARVPRDIERRERDESLRPRP
jgi:hypothetical protein